MKCCLLDRTWLSVAHELSVIGLLGQDLYKIKPVSNSGLDREAHEAPPPDEKVLATVCMAAVYVFSSWASCLCSYGQY